MRYRCRGSGYRVTKLSFITAATNKAVCPYCKKKIRLTNEDKLYPHSKELA